MSVERSRIRLLVAGAAMLAMWPPRASAQARDITVYKNPT